MKISTLLIPLCTLLLSANAQYQIDPDSVPLATRDYWCASQTSQCPLICLQTTSVGKEPIENSCDPTLLTYRCVCSNGLSPNILEYSQTLPYFICTEWGTECVSDCGNDAACASDCRQNHPCGALHPTRVNNTISKTKTADGARTKAPGAGETTDSAGETIYNGFADSEASTPATSDARREHRSYLDENQFLNYMSKPDHWKQLMHVCLQYAGYAFGIALVL